MRARPIRQALDFGERPDPARGIFETLLVERGMLPMRDAHYARLNASAHELYGADSVVSAPRGELPRRYWDGWTRVTFVPGRGVTRAVGFARPDPAYSTLAPFVLPGGLGRHKWADRRLVDAITAAAGERALPLLIDADGAVLEATWANVLIEEGGRLIAPPDDGRALPGIGRRQLEYGEEPVDLDRLLAADAILLTSALRTLRMPRSAS